MSITVLLAEDQRMVLGALGSLLGLEPDIDIIDTATDGDEALRLVQTLQPDILLPPRGAAVPEQVAHLLRSYRVASVDAVYAVHAGADPDAW